MIRFSPQLRPVHPEHDEGRPHPRAIQLARAHVRIAAEHGGACSFADLRSAGFNWPEIIEHCAEAEQLLRSGAMLSPDV